MTVIEGSPEALRVSARALASRSADLRAGARSLHTASGQAARGWQGTASVRFVARAGEVSRSLTTTGERLSVLAVATQRYAAELETAQQRARLLAARQQDASLSVARARARGQDPVAVDRPGDPGAREHANGAVAQAQSRLRGLSDAIDDVLAGQVASARRFVRCLDGWDPSCVVPGWRSDTWVLGTAAKDLVKAAQKSWLAASYTRHARSALKALRAGDLARYLSRGEEAVDAIWELARGKTGTWVRRLPPSAGRVIALGKRTSPLGLMTMGLVDAFTGGGYDGWRGGTTRVLGGGAAVAELALITGVAANPLGLGLAGTAIAVYLSWKVGNYVYDHRRQILGVAKSTWRATQRVGRAAVDAQVRAFNAARWAVTHPYQLAKGGLSTMDRLRRSGARSATRAAGQALGRQLVIARRGAQFLRKHLGPSLREHQGPFALRRLAARKLFEVWREEIPCRLRTLTAVPLPRCRPPTEPGPASGSASW